MLKAKYHKNSSVLDAEISYRPSFIWRSLMGVQDILWKGLRWRLGNVCSVKIWGEKWIPILPDLFAPSAPMTLPSDALVRELVDPDSEQWNAALVESCFPAAITQAVLQIPLRGGGDTDCLIWHRNKFGDYSTQDGYVAWLEDFMVQKS
ncbi:hypothetical protein LINGRAHAP2_LOCUS32154 [Linum grandiflorum]